MRYSHLCSLRDDGCLWYWVGEERLIYYKAPLGAYYRLVSTVTQWFMVYNIQKNQNAAAQMDKPNSV